MINFRVNLPKPKYSTTKYREVITEIEGIGIYKNAIANTVDTYGSFGGEIGANVKVTIKEIGATIKDKDGKQIPVPQTVFTTKVSADFKPYVLGTFSLMKN